MTRSRAPDDLYKNGIQREQFLPCIELIKNTFTVKCLDSDIGTCSESPGCVELANVVNFADYRKRPRELSKVYFDPIDDLNKREFEKLFAALAGDEKIVVNRALEVWGRTLKVPRSTSQIARFQFGDLCGKPLSAADYLEITKTFATIFVADVPQLGLNTKDQARRFILFIDAAYEAKVSQCEAGHVYITNTFSTLRPSYSFCPTRKSLQSSPTSVGTRPKFQPINEPSWTISDCPRK